MGNEAIGKWRYTFGEPIYVEEKYLIGKCNETNAKIIFLPKHGIPIMFHNRLARIFINIELTAYVVCNYNRDMIDRVSFSCPEINYIHPVNQAVNLELDNSYIENGVATITTQDFYSITTDEQVFF